MGLNRKGLITTFLFLLVTVVLLVVFIDLKTVIQQVRQADWRYLGVAIVYLLFGFAAYAIRWWVLLNEKSTLSASFYASNAGHMVNTLLPLRPGDPARILMLGQSEKLPLMEVTTSIVVERWFEQIMRLAALGGAVVFGIGLKVSWLTLFGSVAFLALSFAFMLWMVRRRDYVLRTFPVWLGRLPRLTEDQVRRGLTSLVDGLIGVASARHLVLVLFWSVNTWTCFWVFHYLCLRSLPQSLDFQDQLALSLGSLALVPPSASTLPGIYQVSMVVPLGLVGYDKNLLASYAIVMNLIEMIVIGTLGVWGTMRTRISLDALFHRETPSV